METEIFSSREKAPAIYLFSTGKTGKTLVSSIKARTSIPFSLITVSGLAWNDDLSPWKAGPLFAGSEAFGGNAEHFLSSFLQRIPEIEKSIDVTDRIAAGYSLAGLFSLYAAYRTVLFSAVASVSGSMWFPGFREFVMNSRISQNIRSAYFSLGDKERHTGIDALRSVEEDTMAIEKHLEKEGIKTVFELNRGNHFRAPVERTAKAAAWILQSL